MNEPSTKSLRNQPLPEIVTFGDFIGRERQLREVGERLKGHRLVTIVGPGGIGKTRLSLEIVKRKAGEDAPALLMAVVSFELVPENSEGAVLDALVSGLKLSPGEAGSRTALVKRFQDAPVLLVLDNCETARTSIGGIVRYLLTKCPNLRILANSQQQLGLGELEAVYELPPLSVPDDRAEPQDTLDHLESYQLFVTRAQMAAASWTPEANSTVSMRRILQLTEGIPPAIEIIAAWAPAMSLAQISTELEKTPFAPVTVRDEYDSVESERHRSLLRCFEWSFDHLAKASPKDAEGFNRLGVFVGRFTEDAVKNICEVEAPRELLLHLAKMSLVHPCSGTDPRRYSMLRHTRVFAQEKARACGIWQGLLARHMDYFFNLAVPLNESGEWEQILPAFPNEDWADFIAAADTAGSIGNRSAVWRISRAMSPFLHQQGLWSEREKLNRAAVKAASDANYWVALERSLIDLGIILEAQGLWEDAAEQYRRSLYFANRNVAPNPNHQAMALQHLGTVLARMGDVDGAERAGRKLSEVTRLLDHPKVKARSLDEEGKMLTSRGDLAGAEAKYRESYQVRESNYDDEGLARSRMNIGTILTLRGVWDEAEEELRKSLSFWCSQKIVREQGITLHLLADLFRRQGRYPEARDYCDQSLKCRDDDPKGRAVTLSLLGRILRFQRDFVNALIASQQSRELCRSLGDAEGESIALDDIGTAYALQHLWDEALIALNESLRLKESETRRDIVGLAITFDRIAQIHARRGNWVQARAAYLDSLRYSQEAGRKIPAAVTLMNIAMLHAAQGQKDMALRTLDDAIAVLEVQQSGKAVLIEARKQRSRLDHKMREGSPWVRWGDAAFKNQQLFIRKRFDRERRDKRWKEAAIGYDVLAKDFIESGQHMEAGLALNELAVAYRHLNDFVRSEDAIQKALAIFEEITLPLGRAASWHKLGDLFAKQGKLREAEAAFTESIKLKLECSDEDGEAISQDAMAIVLINAGRFVDAEHAAGRAWEIFSKSGSAWQKWHPLIRILWLKMEQNDLTGAKSTAARLVEAVSGNRELEADAGELKEMTEAGDWSGVKVLLAGAGIIGPAEIFPPAAAKPSADNTAPANVIATPVIVAPAQTFGSGELEVYVSYAWGDDETTEGKRREEVVNQMCTTLRQTGRTVGRDKDVMNPGDSIDTFADKIAKAPRIVAVISAKSLMSSFCMVDELYSAYQRSGFRREEFQTKVIALVMEEAESLLRNHLEIVRHWRDLYVRQLAELQDLNPTHKSVETWAKVHKLGEMCERLPDMLEAIKDIIMPRGYDNIVRGDFQEVINRLPPKRT